MARQDLVSCIYINVPVLARAMRADATDKEKQAQVCFERGPAKEDSITANGWLSFSKDSGKPYRTSSGFIVLNLKTKDRQLVRTVYLKPAVLAAALRSDAEQKERQAQVGFVRTPGKTGDIEGNLWVSFNKDSGKAHMTKTGFIALNCRSADKQQAASRALDQVEMSTAAEVAAALPAGLEDADLETFFKDA